ncbi:MAG TPA: quinone-dependent dihydroorotate dehydrogenase [Pseudomonadales bacterium]
MYAAARTLLFTLEPERSHELALAALALYGRLPGRIAPLQGTPRELMGLTFRNPVGLAAGLDKDARAVEGLARLGFGFVEVGTVTPRAQPGNPRPRLFRLPEAHALINRMGFNNLGVDAMVARLERLRRRGRLGDTRLGVNVGKNRDTPLERAADDYRRCIEAVFPYADYLTLNLSSPNTPGLRTLQSQAALAPLLEQIKEAQARAADRHRRRVPVLVKIAPDLAEADIEIIARTVERLEIDGIIATNTTITRPGLADDPRAAEAGGLSGAPLHPLAVDTVRRLRAALHSPVPIVGVGGIMDAGGGRALLCGGADLLQIYTGFIYRGPALIRELAAL